MYKILRAFLFLFDAEQVHHFSLHFLQRLGSVRLIRKMLRNRFQPVFHPTDFLGLQFQNPVGLAAGFDKNAKYLSALANLGFGFIEIGTVTPEPQTGNDKPRLFRLPKDRGLINRMGFNNDGAELIKERLEKWRKKNPGTKLIVGGNIGKNKSTANANAWRDYAHCFESLHSVVDYFVVNVSSPNTPALRELQRGEALTKIFFELELINKSKVNRKPVLLKIAPDLEKQELDEIISIAGNSGITGFIVSNTTIARPALVTPNNEIAGIGDGGLSGRPLQQRSTEMIRYIHDKTAGKMAIIGNGGIFSGADAAEKISAGATLIQVWTGFIYEGPAITKRICSYLQSR